jgi:hypothetical protein
MNWGYRILTAFLLGVAFIMFFVISSMRMNTDMVEADYYSKELKHEGHMRATANMAEYSVAMKLQTAAGRVILALDTTLARSMENGEVHFYCAADARADRKYALKPSETGMYSFERSALIGGKYTVKISFESKGIPFYKEEVLYLSE